jgi:hypothetical protein
MYKFAETNFQVYAPPHWDYADLDAFNTYCLSSFFKNDITASMFNIRSKRQLFIVKGWKQPYLCSLSSTQSLRLDTSIQTRVFSVSFQTINNIHRYGV